MGGNGNDALHGGGGEDLLIGGAGSDNFWFEQPLAAPDVAGIVDFDVAEDMIVLAKEIFNSPFGGIDPGPLSGDAFHIGKKAQDAEDRIIYDAVKGTLMFDADGVFDPGGSGGLGQVTFATISPGLSLSSSNFVIV